MENKLAQIAPDILLSDTIKRWKSSGKKIIGWFCTYVPEEIIYAADILPIRILGNPDVETFSDAYLQSQMCPYVQSCLTLGQTGAYDFIDGLVAPKVCDAIGRLYDIWRQYIPTGFTHFIDVPNEISTPLALKYSHQETLRFKSAIEQFSGRTISKGDLLRAIKIYNTNRRLLRSIYEFRKESPPRISGLESLQIVMTSMTMEKEENNSLLVEVRKEIQSRSSQEVKGPRLVISGSICDHPEFVQLIEECGTHIVSDSMCTGTRYFWDLIDEQNDDPIAAINQRYLQKIPCACKSPRKGKSEHLLKMVRDFKADGVILYSLKFCDTHQWDFPMETKLLENQGIPVLKLESGYFSLGVGQLRTRVQAFIEMIS